MHTIGVLALLVIVNVNVDVIVIVVVLLFCAMEAHNWCEKSG